MSRQDKLPLAGSFLVNGPPETTSCPSPFTKTQFLVASSGCDYFTDVAYPSDVDIGLAVRRIGKSSVTYDVGLFLADADTTAATGVFVHVNVTTDDQRPVAIDAATRAKCAALMIEH